MLGLFAPAAAQAQGTPAAAHSLTPDLMIERQQIRPATDSLPIPLGYTRAQIVLGDQVFHGERAGGRCFICHGQDAKGGPLASDLTTGMYIWGDGTVRDIRRTVLHNMAVVPGMDGALQPADVDAVAAYIWALGRSNNPNP